MDKIKGAYIEAAVSHDIPLSAELPLTIGALAGFSAGQEVNDNDASELANFNESGLTHLDFSLALPFSAGPLSIAPSFHFLVNNDEFVKITKTTSGPDWREPGRHQDLVRRHGQLGPRFRRQRGSVGVETSEK